MNRAVATAFALLLVGSLPAGVALGAGSAAPDAGVEAPSSQPSADLSGFGWGDSSSDVLHRTTVLRHLPDRQGEFGTEMTFDVPDAVGSFEITLESAAAVRSADGFERTGERTYEWTGGTAEPTIRFLMPTDRRDDVGHLGETRGDGYTFAGGDDWAVVPVPGIAVSRPETVGVDETVAVDGPGAVGNDVAFFGPVTEYDRTVDGETIRLAVPDAVALADSPSAILETLATTSRRLDVGASRDEVFVVAVPPDVDWAARGIQYGGTDAWVVADAPLDEPGNVWIHEYVHVRQEFANPSVGTTPSGSWLVEAQAEYYAATLATERGLIDHRELDSFLERGERSPYADGVLAEPGTWRHDHTGYVKGPFVYGEIDRRLRLATDGDRTLEDVLRLLNARDDPVSGAVFLDALESVGGSAVRDVAERYTRTDRTPRMWSRADHEAAFEQPIAVFEYGSDAVEVADEPWPASASTDGDPGTLVVPQGETVSFPVAVDNVGEHDGTYDATLQVDGSVVDHESARLAAGTSTATSLAWTPTEPGAYDVRVGADRFTVNVRSTASLRVTDLTVAPTSVAPGESVTATATVEAADDEPGAGVLAFRTPAGTAAERPVFVEPGESVTVSAEVTFDDAGRPEIGVGDASATVTVGNGFVVALESMPGFGGPATVAAALAALALLARRA